MYLLIIVAISIILAVKYVKFQQLKSYYSTIQFYILSNLLYNFIFYQHTLWSYNPKTINWLNHTITEILFTFFIVPLVIIIYLRFFPTGQKGLIYIAGWIFLFWLIEYIYNRKGQFIYENGWNIWWSTLFNGIMFPMLRIHFKKPLLAILISLPLIIILLLFFHPSFEDLK